MKEFLREYASIVLCKLGFHVWRYDNAVLKDETQAPISEEVKPGFLAGNPPQRYIALGWRVCERCHESEARFILR